MPVMNKYMYQIAAVSVGAAALSLLPVQPYSAEINPSPSPEFNLQVIEQKLKSKADKSALMDLNSKVESGFPKISSEIESLESGIRISIGALSENLTKEISELKSSTVILKWVSTIIITSTLFIAGVICNFFVMPALNSYYAPALAVQSSTVVNKSPKIATKAQQETVKTPQ